MESGLASLCSRKKLRAFRALLRQTTGNEGRRRHERAMHEANKARVLILKSEEAGLNSKHRQAYRDVK
jgi:hypothetical protein